METTWDRADMIPTEESQPSGLNNFDRGSSNSVSPQPQVLPLTNQKVYEQPEYQAPPKPQIPQPKRQSLYLGANRGFERQESIIVGTPGFREKYGKLQSNDDFE